MGSSTSSIDNKRETRNNISESTVPDDTYKSSSKQTAIKPVIKESVNQQKQPRKQQYDSIFLITAYCRLIINDKGKLIIPSDIINILFIYLHIIFHFDVIPKFKQCGTKNILESISSNIDHSYYNNDDDEELSVVVSINSECIYVGIAGDDTPTLCVPNIISMGNDKDILIGHQLNNNKFNLTASIRPFECGEIKDFDAMKQLFLKIFSKTKDDLKGIILTECVPFLYREEIIKFAFEELKCTKFYLVPRCVLALYASGRTTGIVIYSDYECTEIVPIFEGYSVKNGCKKINFGKRDIIEYLDENKYNKDNKDNVSKDGMELFFDKINIHKEIWQCILKCDEFHKTDEFERDYYRNIVLGGINTMYDGLSERLQNEMIGLISKIKNEKIVKVIAPPERQCSAWIGGSILGSLSTFEQMSIKKKEYLEKGPSIVQNCDDPNSN